LNKIHAGHVVASFSEAPTVARFCVESASFRPRSDDRTRSLPAILARFYVSGNGSSGGRRHDDVARAEVCREDDVREVRGLGGVVFP